MATEEGRAKNSKSKLEEKMKMVDKDEVAKMLDKLEAWKQKNL